MTNPKISILIPTYNRAVFLREALESVASQIEDDIECIVSDNASTDETEEIAKDFQARYSFVRYYKNQRNLGPGRNILSCLNHARGDYAWLFSDDDRMAPGAIKSVKAVLGRHKDLSLVFVNYCVKSQDLINTIESRSVRKFKDELFCSENECLRTIGFHLSFMSSLVLQRQSYLLVQRPEAYSDTNMIPLYVALSVMGEAHKNTFLISYPYVEQRSSNSGGYDYFRCMVEDSCGVLEAVRSLGYKNSAIRKTKNDIIRQALFKRIIALRCTDPASLRGVPGLLIKHFCFYPMFWLMIFPFFATPPFFLRCLRSIYKWVKSQARR
ncbi:MAG: glycosyltransferase family 2 protein [Candidatus Margulisiibacteriota bacterium]